MSVACKPVCLKNITVGIVIGIGVSKLCVILYKRFSKVETAKSTFQTDCLFFSPKQVSCLRKCSRKISDLPPIEMPFPCNGCSLKHLLSTLAKTRKQLDICMYLITSDDVFNIIVTLFKRGVFVRIIMDNLMSVDAHGAKVIPFQKEYIPLKIIQSCHIMHNKFVVIDQQAVITGSVNWTRQGFTGNYENVVIVANKMIAQKFTSYFELLWTSE